MKQALTAKRTSRTARPQTARPMTREEVRHFLEALAQANPDPRSELDYKDPFTLLIAVVLSAQTTDAAVNRATGTLFAEASTPEAMLRLGAEGVARHIRSLGFFNTKARNVIELSRQLAEKYGGQVPRDRESLEALPGVGRKTANVVLNVAFGEPTLAVDTHIFRLGNRTGIAPGKTPLEVEEVSAQAGSGRAPAQRPSLAHSARALCLQSAAAGMLAVRCRGVVPLSGQNHGAREGREMIDCDLHPTLPGMAALMPYLDDHWRDTAVRRGFDELNTIAYPANTPLSVRSGWRDANGRAATTAERLAAEALAPFGTQIAILNCLYGAQVPFSDAIAAAFCRALNRWIAHEWLDRDGRLRASIVVPMLNAELAVDEIDHWAGDSRFVQILLLVGSELPLGRRQNWPIYAAAERHNLPVGIHAGSTYRHPVTPVGWPSYFSEDYVNQAPAFQSQLSSLLAEGVFTKFPGLTVGTRRIGRELAASLALAFFQVLERVAQRDPLGFRPAGHHHPGPCAPHPSALRCSARSGIDHAPDRAYRFRRYAALLHRLSALAVRRHAGHPGRH